MQKVTKGEKNSSQYTDQAYQLLLHSWNVLKTRSLLMWMRSTLTDASCASSLGVSDEMRQGSVLSWLTTWIVFMYTELLWNSL